MYCLRQVVRINIGKKLVYVSIVNKIGIKVLTQIQVVETSLMIFFTHPSL